MLARKMIILTILTVLILANTSNLVAAPVNENQARQAEQQHTLSLTKAQRYALAELRMLYTEADENLRQQIAVLDAVYQQPITRPAVRRILNRIRSESLTGNALLDALTQLYHAHGLDATLRQRHDHNEENDALPYIVCSEGFVM